MSKTLIVSFLPRGERSNTRKVVEAFKAAARGKTEIIERDLDANPPTLMLGKQVMAYIMRDMVGEKTPERDAMLAEYDALVAELKSADYVVVAYPVWNFSSPAVVKAYFDAVLLKGHTWDLGEKGYYGLLTDKKGLVITTSGGDYIGTPMDHAQALTVTEMQFAGIETTAINATSINAKPDQADSVIAEASEKAAQKASEWYSA